jgi:hypothetical protein
MVGHDVLILGGRCPYGHGVEEFYQKPSSQTSKKYITVGYAICGIQYIYTPFLHDPSTTGSGQLNKIAR